MSWKPVAHIQHAANGDIDSITYLTGDQIDTPRLGTDQNQNVVWRWEVDAFGSTEPETNPDGDTRIVNIENRFAGQYADSESGLRYNWHRYYDAESGRYISSDPVGLLDDTNPYVYSGGNSLIYFDPYGLFSISNPATWPTLSQGTVDFAAGLGDGIIDGLSVGLVSGEQLRDLTGSSGVVNQCSSLYGNGNLVGTAGATVLGLAGAVKGAASLYAKRKGAKAWRTNSPTSRKTARKKLNAAGGSSPIQAYRPHAASAGFTLIGGHGVNSWEDVARGLTSNGENDECECEK